MVTYDFPPPRTSGIYRPVKFIKHLGAFGWHPIVLTAKNPYVLDYDSSLLKDIPLSTPVYRTFTIDLARINDWVYRLIHCLPKDKLNSAGTMPSRKEKAVTAAPQKRSWIRRHILGPANVFAESWLYVPDSKVLWLPFALLGALRIMRKEKPDVVYSTSSPPTAQLVGWAVSRLFRKPWVVDFRDNWVVGFAHHYRSRRRAKFDTWLMGRIVRSADQVIAMSQSNADDILAQYPDTDLGKFYAITNGYDEDDFRVDRGTSAARNDSAFVLLHMGTIYENTYGRFFEAVAALLAEHLELRRILRVDLIGYPSKTCIDLIAELDLTENIRLLGFKCHPEAIRAMCTADVLLLFLGGDKMMNQQYPGKFFEYLRAGRPILALGQSGEIVDVLEETNCGVIVPHAGTEEIKNALLELYKIDQSHSLYMTPNAEVIRRYEYRNMTERFTGVLDKAYSTRKSLAGR